MACNVGRAASIVTRIVFEFTPSTLWLIGGIVLMLLELLMPGGIVFFLGFSAACVGLLFLLGVVHSPVSAFIAWFISSLVLLVGFRGIMQRFAPATLEKANTDEDFDAYNQIVEVAETIPSQGEGRIHFRGTTWRARNYDGEQPLAQGSQARLIFRENLVWIVEAVDSVEVNESHAEEG